MFGPAHWFTIGVTVALLVGFPLIALRFLNQRGQVALGVSLGMSVACAYLAWILVEALSGDFDPREHLPLHLCWIANLALPFAMTGRSLRTFEVVYYWGLAAGIQAMMTPTLTPGVSGLYYAVYALQHNGMVIALVYATVVYPLRPTARGILSAFLIGNLLLVIAIPVNILLGSNYFFLCNKPDSASLLDYMGPWPWYILVGEAFALLHFAIAYLPIWLLNLIASTKERPRPRGTRFNP